MLWGDTLRTGHFASPFKIERIYVPSSPLAKVRAIRWYARHYHPRFFVETGTFMGDTTAAVADLFEKCFTIELSEQLYHRACDRLSKLGNVRCLEGDSGQIVSDLIRNRLAGPTLFWLDAHASGGVTSDAGYDPIFAELAAILEDPDTGHVILIDDARGHQVDQIRQMASRGRSFTVKNDIMRIVPQSPPQSWWPPSQKRSEPDALNASERIRLFCLASDTDWQKAGVTHDSAQHMMVRGLIERDLL
jgi:hypothetical protein